MARVVRLLGELGFLPEAVEEGLERRMLMHRSPLREVAVANPGVVCSAHLGLLCGAGGRWQDM